MNSKFILTSLLILLIGIVIGGYIFADVQPRSFLSIHKCNDNCLKPNELLGLAGAVGMKFSTIPAPVEETEKSLVIIPPIKRASIHFVVIPKKDIKDVSDITQEDREYLIDAYTVIGELIRKHNLKKYKVYTNGPGYQTVNYLHFHLLSEKPE